MSWWVHDLYQAGRVAELISWIFWVLFSITLHELAHGWAALWQGDETPRRLQRMTFNPLVHMGMYSLIAFAVIGIAWGVMPVDPSRFRWGRRGRVVVSGAGPAMNLALALLTLVALGLWLPFGPRDASAYGFVTAFLWTGCWLNVVLAVLNLLPVPPLDGSSILSGLSFKAYQFFQRPEAQRMGLILLLVILFGGGSILFGAAFAVASFGVNTLSGVFGGPPVWDVLT